MKRNMHYYTMHYSATYLIEVASSSVAVSAGVASARPPGAATYLHYKWSLFHVDAQASDLFLR